MPYRRIYPMPSRGADADDGGAFRLVTVHPTGPPAGCVGNGWLVYEICQGTNRIKGYRRGTVPDVTADVEKIVVGLNERRGRTAKTPPAAPRAATPAQAATGARVAAVTPVASVVAVPNGVPPGAASTAGFGAAAMPADSK